MGVTRLPARASCSLACWCRSPARDLTAHNATAWIMLAAWAVGCFIAFNSLTGRWQEYQLEIWMPVYALGRRRDVRGPYFGTD